MKDIMQEIGPLPDLHCLHRGTRKDIENRRDHYRLCSDPGDTEEVGVHVHHGCFNIGDAKTAAEEIQRRCNSYPILVAKVGQQAAAIAELVGATSTLLRHCRHLQNIVPGDDADLFRDMEAAFKLVAKHKAGET